MSWAEHPHTPTECSQNDDDALTPRAPKRRRLRGKQSPAEVVPEDVSVSGAGESSSIADTVTEDSERALDDPGDIEGTERSRLALRYWRWWRKKVNFDQVDVGRQQKLLQHWSLRGLDIPERRHRLAIFAEAHPHLESRIRLWLHYMLTKEKGGSGFVRRADSCFLTWNGEWGVLRPLEEEGSEPCAGPDAALGALRPAISEDRAREVARPRGQPAALPAVSADSGLDPEAGLRRVTHMCELLRERPDVVRLREALDAVMAALRESLPVHMAVWALEICSRTLEETGVVRLHAHAFVILSKRVRLQPEECMVLLGTMPHIATRLGSDSFTRTRNTAAGLWYLQGPKVSTVYVKGTHQPFEDYGVNPLWIFRSLQAGKTTVASAREAMLRIPMGLPRNLEALDRWQRERCERLVMAAVEDRAEQVRAVARPFRRFPVVELWKAQYGQTLDRYRFLVLEGPSRMGKTAFVYSLVERRCCYEMNLAGGANPDLRDYSANEHMLLFFDECSPQQTVANKKLFQAGIRPVSLNTSATNMYAIKVYVGGKMMVCASNDWTSQLRRMPREDADWVAANSYVLHVSAPMWEEGALDTLPAS